MTRDQQKTLFYGIVMNYLYSEQIELSLPKCIQLWKYFELVYNDLDQNKQKKILKRAKKVLKEKK